jgi:hypothetical protein
MSSQTESHTLESLTAKVLEVYPIGGIQPTAQSIFQVLQDHLSFEEAEVWVWGVVDEIVERF